MLCSCENILKSESLVCEGQVRPTLLPWIRALWYSHCSEVCCRPLGLPNLPITSITRLHIFWSLIAEKVIFMKEFVERTHNCSFCFAGTQDFIMEHVNPITSLVRVQSLRNCFEYVILSFRMCCTIFMDVTEDRILPWIHLQTLLKGRF